MILHVPVLLDEVVEYLNPQPGQHFVDCTFGGGGYTKAILKHTAPNGRILAIDADASVGDRAQAFLDKYQERICLVNNNFRNLKDIYEQKFCIPVSGIVFDLGVSSFQLEEGAYGISFRNAGPLVMRFDQDDSSELTASAIVNRWSQDALVRIFRKYGEEVDAVAVARAIVRRRKTQAITTTDQLAEIVLQAKNPKQKNDSPSVRGRIHPATKVFQALRIAVNDELGALKEAIAAAEDILETGGRLAVVTFHSLEDRIVKRFISKSKSLEKVTRRAVSPKSAEVSRNSRSRSAKLRIAEKV